MRLKKNNKNGVLRGLVRLLAVAFMLSPSAVWAQSDDDLLDFGGSASDSDASADAPAEPPASEPDAEPAASAEPTAESVSDGPETDSREQDEQASLREIDPSSLDRVKAVPRKPMLKRMRLEISPYASVSLNDAFFYHLAAGGSVVFYPNDSFGIGVGADYLWLHAKTPNEAVVRETQQSVFAEFEQPRLFAHLDFYWVPLYGKVSLFDDNIIHFDTFLVAGGGVASALGGEFPPAVNVGVGQRYVLNDWLALRLEARDHLFVASQQVNDLPRSDIQNFLMFQLGVSIFVPPSFEYTIR